jgi:hypothetical protein
VTVGTGKWRSKEGCGGGAGPLPWEPFLLWVSIYKDALEGSELIPPAR